MLKHCGISKRYQEDCKLQKRDNFIDFLKGISILFVIFTHNLPHSVKMAMLSPYWLYLAVPIFLIIQVSHLRNKTNIFDQYKWTAICKMFKNILFPYIIVQLLIFVLLYILHGKIEETDIHYLGTGAYYIFIYLSFYFVSPIYLSIYRKLGKFKSLIFSLLIVLGINYFWSYIDFPYKNVWYRYCASRYLFLIYLSYFFFRKESLYLYFWGVIGAIIICLDAYWHFNFKPFIYSGEWASFNFMAYPYSFCFLYILERYYKKWNLKNNLILFFGENSYLIFLSQMLFFTVIPAEYFKTILNISSSLITYIIYIPISCVFVLICVPIITRISTLHVKNSYIYL